MLLVQNASSVNNPSRVTLVRMINVPKSNKCLWLMVSLVQISM